MKLIICIGGRFRPFNEIGEGLYSNVINIRYKLAHNKNLVKENRTFTGTTKNLLILR